MQLAAYLIVTAVIPDRAAFMASGYPAAAAEAVEKFGGRYLVRGPGAELLEGNFGEGGSIVISQWPSKEAARRFWNSDEYGRARTLRDGLGECQVLLIEAPEIV